MECIDKVRTLGESKIRLLEDHIRTDSLKSQSTFDQTVASHSKIIEVHKREMNRIVFAISKYVHCHYRYRCIISQSVMV